MPAKEMPIFTRTFDLLAWLLPMTNHFPRAHRHTVTKRLIDAAFDLRECLEEANLRRRDERRRALVGADEALGCESASGTQRTVEPAPPHARNCWRRWQLP